MVKNSITLNERINKLIPIVNKYFPEADKIQAIEILKEHTNYKYDTFREIEEQIAFYQKQVKKGGK